MPLCKGYVTWRVRRRGRGRGREKSEPTVLEDEPTSKLTASDTNCQPDIRACKKRNEYITDLEESGELDVINKCCEFNSDKEENDKFKGYNMHCEAAFTMKKKDCFDKGIGKDKDRNCHIKSGSYEHTFKKDNQLGDWRRRPDGYLPSA
jgi:hypothetical protein